VVEGGMSYIIYKGGNCPGGGFVRGDTSGGNVSREECPTPVGLPIGRQ